MSSLLVIFALFGLYSQIPLTVGEAEIPNVIGLTAGALLLGINCNRMPVRHLRAISAVLGVAFVSILLAPNVMMYMPRRVLAVIQLSVSIFTGYGLYLELRKQPTHYTSRLMLGCCAIILIGSAMEAFTPLRSSITNVTSIFFDFDSESQLRRDLNIAGFARPTFLTSEPSHVAKGVIIFSISALILNPTPKVMYLAASLQLLGLVTSRGPSIALGFAMIFIVYYFAQRRHPWRLERSRRSLRSIVLLVVVGVPIIAGGLVFLSERIAHVLSGNDYSTTIRLFTGISIGVDAAMLHPISGVGLGGFEAAQDLIIRHLIRSGVPGSVATALWDRQINNGIGAHLLYFGFVLLPLYLLVFFRLLDRISAGNGTMVMLIMFCFCFLTGGIYSPRFVTYYFVVAAVAHIAFRSTAPGQTLGESRSRIQRPPFPPRHMMRGGEVAAFAINT